MYRYGRTSNQDKRTVNLEAQLAFQRTCTGVKVNGRKDTSYLGNAIFEKLKNTLNDLDMPKARSTP